MAFRVYGVCLREREGVRDVCIEEEEDPLGVQDRDLPGNRRLHAGEN